MFHVSGLSVLPLWRNRVSQTFINQGNWGCEKSMTSLYQPFLSAVISEHSSAVPRSHKLFLLLLSVLYFSRQLSPCPSHPLHSLLGSPDCALQGWVCRTLSSDGAYKKPACRWKGYGEEFWYFWELLTQTLSSWKDLLWQFCWALQPWISLPNSC